MTSLHVNSISPKCKSVIVGVDFGTAYSGIALAFKQNPNSVSFPVLDNAYNIKTPTVLLKLGAPDPKTGKIWFFGGDVEQRYGEALETSPPHQKPQLFKRFKMVLKDKTSGMDSLVAYSETGESNSLMELITVALYHLKDIAMTKILATKEAEILEIDSPDDVTWVITVPAIWNDFGKALMRRAAFNAGMISTEDADNLTFAFEPEAAAFAIQQGASSTLGNDRFNIGTKFIVLDCGGGTIDITAHEMKSTDPFTMASIQIPTGGSWGGEYVNDEFKKFLRKLLGWSEEELAAKELEMPIEFHQLYSSFNILKREFDPLTSVDTYMLDLREVAQVSKEQLVQLYETFNSCHPKTSLILNPYARNQGRMCMSKELMYSFFEPLLFEITVATQQTLDRIPGKVDFVMVVGGFGSSKILGEHIRAEFSRSTTVIVPSNPRPQAAIMHGAVYYGLHDSTVISRIAPYSYGVAWGNNGFRLLVRKGAVLPIGHEERLSGAVPPGSKGVKWMLLQSDKADPETMADGTELGYVVMRPSTNPNLQNNTQTAVFNFGSTEFHVTIVDSEGRKQQGVINIK